ncbi:MAG TPA: glycogen-binding domain-containing protein, partial [Gemmatimonadaceae bacterium]|nr:glycogen-binding domain-containing protein [Gemmatimonadaceae bacterium]
MMHPHASRARHRTAAAALIVLTSLGLADAASAQVVPSLDVGTHAIDQRGAPAVSGAALAPAVRAVAPFGSVDASALRLFGASGPARDLWTASLGASLTTPRSRALRGELGGALRRDVGPAFSAVSSAQAETRLRYERAALGLWTSQATGQAEGGRSFGGLGAGFWARVLGVTVTTSFSWMRARDSIQKRVLFDTTITSWRDTARFRDTSFKTPFGTDTSDRIPDGYERIYFPKDTTLTRVGWGLGALAYTDVESGLQWAFRGVELGARAGTRLGVANRSRRQWASATGSLRVSRHAALVMLVGREPEDIARGIPARSFASVGMRLARTPLLGLNGHGAPAVPREPAAAAALPGFEVGAGDAPGTYTLRVRAPGASDVEVMGSFTEWQPVSLRPAGEGAWSVTLAIPAGVHQINMRVDRGSWRAPPGLTTAVDGFNG